MQPARILGLGLGLLGLATSASLQALEDSRFYVAPMASYGFFDDDDTNIDGIGDINIDPDDDAGYSLAIGKPLSDVVNLEIYAFRFDDIEDQNSGQGFDIDGYGLNALFFPYRETFPIFGILGVAAGDYDPVDSNGTFDGSANGDADYIDVGLGYVQKFFNYGLGVRLEYRYRSADVEVDNAQDVSFGDHIINLGLQIPLGAGPEQPEPEPERAAPPPPPPPAPRDSDGDGVLDKNDDCPGTPPNTEVDDRGCPLEKAAPIVLKGVTFEFNSAQLTSEATTRLDNVVNALKAAENVEVRIEGHTDSIDTDAYNLKLSDERAASVRQYLIDKGIDGSRLTSKGFGESQPVAPNNDPDGSDNPEGRAQNRRVELEVTNQ